MGRAFEFRKERKFKRWGNMARVFTRLGKEITMAAKSGGTDPDNNPRLRALISNARAENMPKDNIERAIKRAVEKDHSEYKEVVYEGYGPHGIAFLVETATDNTTRTVANIRSYFNKFGGSLGTSGSVEFMFERKSVFKVKSSSPVDIEELELELIDYGAEELFMEEDEIVIYGSFESYGNIQKFIEEKGYELVTGGFERIPTTELKQLNAEERTEIEKLIERFENDDDVQSVYHTMAS
ncbi:putative transcriptional regulatory protein [bioreactor metagenome]|uniref:Putative transcriptional regulatory protein n=1 Tax=bioreactor metagenome TaxID=1076179 RepID=A0A644XHP4_9ZZZZ|nr:YebC/PmpR family DNA-binding transcriptional regulator [Rikenellaceae bacterium]